MSCLRVCTSNKMRPLFLSPNKQKQFIAIVLKQVVAFVQLGACA